MRDASHLKTYFQAASHPIRDSKHTPTIPRLNIQSIKYDFIPMLIVQFMQAFRSAILLNVFMQMSMKLKCDITPMLIVSFVFCFRTYQRVYVFAVKEYFYTMQMAGLAVFLWKHQETLAFILKKESSILCVRYFFLSFPTPHTQFGSNTISTLF